jgi:hypothetical protein
MGADKEFRQGRVARATFVRGPKTMLQKYNKGGLLIVIKGEKPCRGL